ncbi:mercuric transport protein periplasmic component [Hydrogenophaga crassostreae]|uniref:Periplasmic mercury ion-binding protein n=1 Tax=Hydrogenophaga crassostreae TaxID=1763535 RepID=A0A162P5Y0_9BURK|nr:mercury resistance system periplasmic binding protein MerP [Hydrogenophaga crassostreae]AOW13370.1 mercuric transport protein periplasmic component [Hydrogenophaga crassostreae]OAD41654.1 mercuric transport protein periplasmic component [Hydrogenophaga crassostreae]
MNKFSLALASICLATAPAWAAVQTVTLSVPSMDCPVCPITVKKALANVPGVDKAEVNFDKRQATVTFDDAKTDVTALTQATTNAGYPSTLAKQP